MNQFQEKGYCVVKNVLSDELRDFVTQYALFDEMQDFNADGVQVPNAHAKYADPAMEVILLHIQKIMQENTGLELFPTYSFHRVYRNGDELKTHKDRPSCEISATMCFNYSYDDSKYSWPIYMEGFKAELKPGDMVIYKGCDLLHWREPFDYEEDAWHVQGFFHYVDKNGPYSNFKFDRRDSIGQLKQPKKVNQIQPSKPYITFL
jgi:hypothetical protein